MFWNMENPDDRVWRMTTAITIPAAFPFPPLGLTPARTQIRIAGVRYDFPKSERAELKWPHIRSPETDDSMPLII